MRERIFVDRGTVAYTEPYYIIGGVYKNYYTPEPYIIDGLWSGMVDVVTENYHERSARGEIINNPYWKIAYQLNQRPSAFHGVGKCQYVDDFEKWALFPPDFPRKDSLVTTVDSLLLPFSDESSIAQASAWANIDVSEIQGLASLGELPETVKMIVDLFKEMVKLTIAAKRGDISTIAKKAKAVGFTVDGLSNLWLGYRYGIRPLVSDFNNLLAAVSAELEKGMRFTARGKYVVEPTEVKTDGLFLPWGQDGTWHGFKYKKTVSQSRSFRAGVLVQIDNAINATSAIWGLDSPIEAAWELVPFSFIIDWFVNVGDCLAAAIINPSLSPLSSWVTERIQYSQFTQCVGWEYYTPLYCNCTTVHEHTRSGYTALNLQAVRRLPVAERFSLPRLNVKLDISKLTDLILIARKMI